jgi:hypothetical protein
MPRARHRILLLVPVVVAAYAVVVLVASFWAKDLDSAVLLAVVGMPVFATVGALIEDRRPGNPMGRICLVVGLTLVASTTLRIMAQRLDAEPGTLPPLGALLALASSLAFSSSLFLGQILVLSRFPDGRAPGALGRLTDAVLAIALGMSILASLRPGPIEFGWVEDVPNPIGLEPLSGPILEFLSYAGFPVYAIALLSGLAALRLAYRRGSSVARAQIRWFIAAASTSALLLVVLLTDALGPVGWDLWLLSTLLTPVAVGIAILRYRLYDIDRIISRTISYALVSAVLAALFIAMNLGVGTLVASLTGGSTLAVAASTLVVAALFQPLRRLVQAPVDRRFNRARVDADRTLQRFGERVRDEVDLARIEDSVRGTTAVALRPTGVGVWLRAERR